jgi:hypothetical protein
MLSIMFEFSTKETFLLLDVSCPSASTQQLRTLLRDNTDLAIKVGPLTKSTQGSRIHASDPARLAA